MVKSTNFWERDDAPFRRRVNAPWRGRVFLKGEMGSRAMIVREIGRKHAAQVRRPRGRRMLRDRHMDDSSALMREQHQDEQHASGDGRDGEEVHRDQGHGVIGEAQGSSPSIIRS